ncbi:hypothetical protein NADE_006371 [Nannochloris sp. 'desiccata']|nr:hypothetical protein NADE_006371 [Chlorella desiccata (nom. nud.)]
MPGGNSGGPVTASSLLARSEEEFRRELEDDVRQFGENGFPTLISKSNLAARLADTSPELSLKLHLEVLEGKLKSHGNKAVTADWKKNHKKVCKPAAAVAAAAADGGSSS